MYNSAILAVKAYQSQSGWAEICSWMLWRLMDIYTATNCFIKWSTVTMLHKASKVMSTSASFLGLATVDHIRRTYGNHITVPVTVLVAVVGACSHTRYMGSRWPSMTVCCTAVYSRCTGVRVPVNVKVGILFGFRILSCFIGSGTFLSQLPK